MIKNDLLSEAKQRDLEEQRRNEESMRNSTRRSNWIRKWYQQFGYLPTTQTNINIVKIQSHHRQRVKGHQQMPPEMI